MVYRDRQNGSVDINVIMIFIVFWSILGLDSLEQYPKPCGEFLVTLC